MAKFPRKFVHDLFENHGIHILTWNENQIKIIPSNEKGKMVFRSLISKVRAHLHMAKNLSTNTERTLGEYSTKKKSSPAKNFNLQF